MDVVHVLVSRAEHLVRHKHQWLLHCDKVVVLLIVFQHCYRVVVRCCQEIILYQLRLEIEQTFELLIEELDIEPAVRPNLVQLLEVLK